MKKILFAIMLLCSLVSCGTSETVVSTGVNLSEYEYCLLGTGSTSGDADVTDIILRVENILPEVFTIVSKERAYYLAQEGNKVLTPDISVKSEKWDGGYSYISVAFRDWSTGRLLAVTKSSGQGMSIKEDQHIALQKIRKELLSLKSASNLNGNLNCSKELEHYAS